MEERQRLHGRVFITAAACLALVLFAFCDARGGEQYLVLNIIPGEQHDSLFQQIGRLVQGSPPGHVRLGIGAIFSYLNEPGDQCKTNLLKFLGLAEQHNIPVVVQLDGEQWWEARSDLWNWWDQERPGYDQKNKWNVEWSGWGPEHAVKIAWRNWGRQIRVLPPPNFMSLPYRRACHDEMKILVPLILQWWGRLPEEKKSLLIGIKLGWESAIGVNSFYYPDGNALLDQPEGRDPQVELKGDLLPGRGVTAIGYAAVRTAQLADSGVLQEAHLAEIVRRHLGDLCSLAAGLGVPREKLFTHVGGWKDEELLYYTALNRYSCPGWSFYRYASDATKDKGVQNALQRSDAPFWAAVEWMLMEKKDSADWHQAIDRTLSDPRCRYMCIYNWTGIKDIGGAVSAIKEVLEGANR